jgi:peptidoglycan/LPS O-acetylase OafA/YrhL
MSSSGLQYRPEIDGMRAVAVLAVVAFHAFPGKFPGGFIGVDIFFVLSGYLISSIILNDLSSGTFSLADFYSRRIRRIFPALSVVLAFCLAVGWAFLMPDEWRSLTRHVLGGAGFLSNIVLAREAGYFDAAGRTKPLLHLWSLGIEEQFYILWPLTLAFLWRRTSRLLLAILLIVAFSFALNVTFVHRYPTATFYYPLTRIWELLAGAALARITFVYGPVRRRFTGELLGATGALMVLAALALLNPMKPFPGWWALLPVLGTALAVRAGPESWLNRRLLASRPAVFVGLISYPLYLWHWPLLAYLVLLNRFTFHFSSGQLVKGRVAAVMIAFVLAWATRQFWEKPMRFSLVLSSSFRVKGLLAGMAAVAVLAALGLRGAGPRHNSATANELARAQEDSRYLGINYKEAEFSLYEIPSAAKHATLLVGDSHMEHYMPRFEAAIQANPGRAAAVFAISGGCPPLPGLNQTSPGFRCPAFYDYWTNQARQARFTTVVLSAFWEFYTIGSYVPDGPSGPPLPLTFQGHKPTASDYDEIWRGLETTLRSLVQAGKRVVIFTPSPASYSFNPKRGFEGLRPISRRGFEQFLAPVNTKLAEVARNSGAEIVNPLDYLCHGDECSPLDSHGAPLYRDEHHLRASKVATVAAFVDDVLRP